LDLSFFNDCTHNFQKFLKNINTFPIDFESILSYVQLPEMTDKADGFPEADRRDAHKILSWLRGKKVEAIIDLQVPDALYGHHREETIESALDLFVQIESLDWRKPDISVETLRAAKNLRIVWLYSSGNWGPLGYWTSNEGISTLDNVCVP
jgi:hypothetical protein